MLGNATAIRVSDIKKFDFYRTFSQEDRDNLFIALEDIDKYGNDLKLLPRAKEVITSIINSGNKVIFISATPESIQDYKRKWMLKQFPMLSKDDIIFTEKKELLNVDLMIDDNPNFMSKFTCPFILFKQPWNSYEEKYPDNVIICSNWNEIEKFLFEGNVIKSEFINKEVMFSKATVELIDGIKAAKDYKECIAILNPYIEKWQKQGILLGISEMTKFIKNFAENVDKEIKI